jgi:hypothetical protein
MTSLKRKRPALITKIKDVYGVVPSEEETTTHQQSQQQMIEFVYDTPGVQLMGVNSNGCDIR